MVIGIIVPLISNGHLTWSYQLANACHSVETFRSQGSLHILSETTFSMIFDKIIDWKRLEKIHLVRIYSFFSLLIQKPRFSSSMTLRICQNLDPGETLVYVKSQLPRPQPRRAMIKNVTSYKKWYFPTPKNICSEPSGIDWERVIIYVFFFINLFWLWISVESLSFF